MDLKIVEVDLLNNKKDRLAFINLPWTLYKDDPHWIPVLKMAQEEIFKKNHPFYQVGHIKAWIARKDGVDVGRIVAIINDRHNQFHNEKTGFYGFFESIDDQKVSQALFQRAEDYIKSQGMNKIRGPLNPSTNYEGGNLIDGFDGPPVMMMNYNPPFYQNHIESMNYTKAMDLLAYHSDLNFEMPEVIKKVCERAEQKSNITFRTVQKKNWKHEVETMWNIYNDAWEDNWGFVPMTKDEFHHTAKDLKAILDERTICFALVDGEEAGFIVALPDLNQVFKKIPSGKLLPFGIFKLLNMKKHVSRTRVITLGVRKKFRKLGLEAILYHRTHQNLLATKQYKEVEMSWILEDNLNMNKPLLRMGARPYRTYRIFEKEI